MSVSDLHLEANECLSMPLFKYQEGVVGPEARVSHTAEALHGPSEAVSFSDQSKANELSHHET